MQDWLIQVWNDIVLMWNDFKDEFVLNFVADNRWRYLTDGLRITLTVTFFALLLGIVIGVIAWTILHVCTGKAKKNVSVLMYILTVLFILKYILL